MKTSYLKFCQSATLCRRLCSGHQSLQQVWWTGEFLACFASLQVSFSCFPFLGFGWAISGHVWLKLGDLCLAIQSGGKSYSALFPCIVQWHVAGSPSRWKRKIQSLCFRGQAVTITIRMTIRTIRSNGRLRHMCGQQKPWRWKMWRFPKWACVDWMNYTFYQRIGNRVLHAIATAVRLGRWGKLLSCWKVSEDANAHGVLCLFQSVVGQQASFHRSISQNIRP